MKLRMRLNKFPLKVVDDALKRWFYRLGVCIGNNPGYFIIIPVLLTALCATGFQRMYYNYDPEYLLSPSTGRAKVERVEVEDHFPTNYSFFQATRMTRVGKFGRVIITAADGGSLLRSSMWADIIGLDSLVHSFSVLHEGQHLHYADLCARWNGQCKKNEILGLAPHMADIEAGSFSLSSPITFDPYTFVQYTLPTYFGGIQEDEFGTVSSVEAVSLVYFLDVSEDWMEEVGGRWERAFLNQMDRFAEESDNVKLTKYVSSTPAWEMEKSKNSITPHLLINIVIMIIFCLGASSMSDAVRSKPIIGFLGLFSASLATLAGFGFICYLGVDFISLCLAAPFLLLGIGIDDTFVMLSAWRRSSHHTTVPERMGRAFSEAAVSITVTSITDVLSFLAGVITPFPAVRIFCLYTGTAVAFIYVWHLTFFGACLAISGFAEKSNRHGLLCFKTIPKSLSANRPWFYRAFCAGGINPVDPYNPEDNKDHAGMVFLRDKLGYALNLKWVKSLVLIVFTAYIVVSIWGITNIQEGLEKRNTVNFDSYSINFFDEDDKYYRDYRFPINIVVSGDVLYSDPDTQAQIERMLRMFENSSYVAPDLTTSWLRDFTGFIERNQDYDDMEILVDSEEEFVTTLRTLYLSDPSTPLHLDLQYSEDGTRIEAARFLVQCFGVKDAMQETQMVEELRHIADSFSGSFKVTVFHPYFIYVDQYLEIMPQTIQSVLVTSAFMMVISFIMIPNPMCSLWVAFSILSIEAGVLGYMTWWGVNLDGIALINLIMCIGFSVDFSAHICYHYMSEEGRSPEERISASLYALGLPIIQGAISTILGVIGLAFAPSYVYVTFFKMMFLVIFLGVAHGLILLPVLLSLFGPGSCSGGSRDSTDRSLSSSPATIVSVHSKQACYTINLGFSTPDVGRRKEVGGSSSPHLTSIEHFQRRQQLAPSPNSFREFRQSEFHPDRFTFITRIAEEGRASPPIRVVGVNDPRLTPVPESDEQYDSIIAQLGHRGHHLSTSNASSIPVTPLVGIRSSPLVGRTSQTNARLGSESPYHSPLVRHPPPNKKVLEQQKKALCRSKSHKPRTSTVSDKQLLQHLNPKQPLRKYHSFPYHMFINDGGYSSDESINQQNN